MSTNITRGLASGALGTAALNMTTYLDVAIRGRGMSSVPQKDVEKLVDHAGVDLAAGVSDEDAENRKQGLGALMGYVTGLSVGAVYGLVRPHAPGVPLPIAAVAVGLGAMAATDGATTMLGNADPTEWSAKSWAMDIVPHLAYGAATVVGYESFGD
jgi:cysteine synthase